jgi:major type 1 subunit fimbrin (pilin)
MKHQLIAASMLMAVSGAQLAHAGDGVISFTGAISATTCTVSINDSSSGDASIQLPSVSSHGLNAGLGQTAGTTNFNVTLSNCLGVLPDTNALMYFEGGAGINPDGTLANTATSGSASGIALQINDSNNAKVIVGSDTQRDGVVSPISVSEQGATMAYSVQYVSTAATVSPGIYTGAVTYSIDYQ